jgi:hypothetical protein
LKSTTETSARTYALSPSPGANPTGRLANKPMRKLDSAEMAAVVVMRSRWTSSTQRRYVESVAQPSPVGHTHVPPVSEIIEALTEIYEDKIRQWTSRWGIYNVGRTMYAIAAWVRVIN